jgi:hypothetical protein
MKNLLSPCLAFCFFLFASCNQEQKPAAAQTEKPTPQPESAPASTAKFPVNCFEEKFPDGSVISLQYIEYLDEVVGILDYAFAEKDGAHGTFKGKKEGNMINATWTYMVEGSTQSEAIMIKLDGDKAVKASGELVEGKNGTLSLKDPAKATWAETFARVQCD